MFLVMEFDQYDIIDNFKQNYGSESHKLYEKVGSIVARLNKETNSDLFKLKIDDGGDWDDPLRIYICLKSNVTSLKEDIELDEGSSFATQNRRLTPTQKNLKEFKARQRQINNKPKITKDPVSINSNTPNLK